MISNSTFLLTRRCSIGGGNAEAVCWYLGKLLRQKGILLNWLIVYLSINRNYSSPVQSEKLELPYLRDALYPGDVRLDNDCSVAVVSCTEYRPGEK